MSGAPPAVVSGALDAGTADAGTPLLRNPAPVFGLATVLVVLSFAVMSPAHALVCAATSATLVVLSAVDIERGIIPNRIVLPAAAGVLVAQIALFPGHAVEWLLAALLAALFFIVPHLLSRSSVGMGDVKLALLLGAALGWQVAGAVVLAFVCVFPVALVALFRGGMAARKTTLPFGPFLSLGAVIVLFGPHLGS